MPLNMWRAIGACFGIELALVQAMGAASFYAHDEPLACRRAHPAPRSAFPSFGAGCSPFVTRRGAAGAARRRAELREQGVTPELAGSEMGSEVAAAAAWSARDPSNALYRLLVWLAHHRTLLQQPCAVCGSVLK